MFAMTFCRTHTGWCWRHHDYSISVYLLGPCTASRVSIMLDTIRLPPHFEWSRWWWSTSSGFDLHIPRLSSRPVETWVRASRPRGGFRNKEGKQRRRGKPGGNLAITCCVLQPCIFRGKPSHGSARQRSWGYLCGLLWQLLCKRRFSVGQEKRSYQRQFSPFAHALSRPTGPAWQG